MDFNQFQPAFNQKALERACTIMCEESAALVRRLRADSQIVDVCELMGELTIAVIARTLFTSDVRHHVPIIRYELDLAQRLGNVLLRTPLPLYRAVPYLPIFNRIIKSANRVERTGRGQAINRFILPPLAQHNLFTLLGLFANANIFTRGRVKIQLGETLTLFFANCGPTMPLFGHIINVSSTN